MNTGQFTAKDLTGAKIGKLTALHATARKYHGYIIWICECECGNRIDKPSQVLHKALAGKGGVRSCGCIPTGRKPLPNGESYFRDLYSKAKRMARREHKSFALSRKLFRALVNGDCHYCGHPPQPRSFGRLSGTFAVNGIDRVCSSKGYRVGNVVSCCWQCNRAKATMTVEQFLAWIRRVAIHQGASF